MHFGVFKRSTERERALQYAVGIKQVRKWVIAQFSKGKSPDDIYDTLGQAVFEAEKLGRNDNTKKVKILIDKLKDLDA